jgi:hypothetical protein
MIAEPSDMDSDPVGTMAVARSIFSHLPPGAVHFWQGRNQIVTFDSRLFLEAMAPGS